MFLLRRPPVCYMDMIDLHKHYISIIASRDIGLLCVNNVLIPACKRGLNTVSHTIFFPIVNKAYQAMLNDISIYHYGVESILMKMIPFRYIFKFRMEVVKICSLICPFSVLLLPVRLFECHLYLTGAAVAQLQWSLSNMSMILNS